MKYSQEEIITALKIIQDTCKERQGERPCENCPLSINNGTCVVQNQSPEEWKIKTNTSVWMAFEE